MIILKCLLIGLLVLICYQDVRDRLVYWFLFPIVGLFLGVFHFQAVGPQVFMMTTVTNCVLVVFMLLVLTAYVRVVSGFARLQEVFGLGDICMLLALSLGSATVAFIVLLVFGLLFSLLLHVVLKSVTLSRKRTHPANSVPLAGYLSIFFSAVLVAHWAGVYNPLYVL